MIELHNIISGNLAQVRQQGAAYSVWALPVLATARPRDDASILEGGLVRLGGLPRRGHHLRIGRPLNPPRWNGEEDRAPARQANHQPPVRRLGQGYDLSVGKHGNGRVHWIRVFLIAQDPKSARP